MTNYLLKPVTFGKKPARKTSDELESSIEALTARMELQDRTTMQGAAVYRVLEAMRDVDLKLTRFRGHPTFWVEGVHDVEAKTTLPT